MRLIGLLRAGRAGTVRAVPEWMTVGEAAAYLKVDRSTLYRWVDQRLLTAYELESGGGRRYRREDLDALLKPTDAAAPSRSRKGRPRKQEGKSNGDTT